MGKWNDTGYSADVQLWLVCGPRRIKLSHASSTFVVAAESVNLPACEASVEVIVDGFRFERPVNVPGGLAPDIREVPVYARDAIAPF